MRLLRAEVSTCAPHRPIGADRSFRIRRKVMTDTPAEPRFTWVDVEQWADHGLIRSDQVQAIRAHVARVSGLTPPAADSHTMDLTVQPVITERRAGLNLVTVAYYFGAFMILLAYTFFLGLQWEDLGRGGQAVVACGTVAGLWGIGRLLRNRGYPLAGNLLIFAGTGVTALAVYSVLRLAGLWPESVEAGAYRDFYRTIDGNWVILEVACIAVALAIAWWTRFSLLTLLIGFWGWYLSMDVTEAVTGHEDFAWGPLEWSVGTALGLVMLLIGVWLQRRRDAREWSLWFYIFGHVAVIGNLGALALDDGPAWGLLFLAIYLGFVAASVWLQSRVFLVFGALGCYAYVSKLAFDVFAGSLGFVFSLALVGLLIVLSAVGYQRYVQPWLTRQLAPAAGVRSAGT